MLRKRWYVVGILAGSALIIGASLSRTAFAADPCWVLSNGFCVPAQLCGCIHNVAVDPYFFKHCLARSSGAPGCSYSGAEVNCYRSANCIITTEDCLPGSPQQKRYRDPDPSAFGFPVKANEGKLQPGNCPQ